MRERNGFAVFEQDLDGKDGEWGTARMHGGLAGALASLVAREMFAEGIRSREIGGGMPRHNSIFCGKSYSKHGDDSNLRWRMRKAPIARTPLPTPQPR